MEYEILYYLLHTIVSSYSAFMSAINNVGMQAFKAAQFHHSNKEILPVLEIFRQMVNEAIRIGKEYRIRSRNKVRV